MDLSRAGAITLLMRRRRDLSRPELVALLAADPEPVFWHEQYLRKIESGTDPIPVGDVETLARVLGISVRQLTGRAPLPPDHPAAAGAAIRAERLAQHLSLRALLDRLHAQPDSDLLPRTQQALLNIETGRTRLRPRYAATFERALGLPSGSLTS